MDSSWSVYIVECADETLYTGVARSVQARVIAHNSGKGARYTRGRLPVRLIYQEDDLTRAEAQSRESAIKKLHRAEKIRLVEESNEKRPGLSAIGSLAAPAEGGAGESG